MMQTTLHATRRAVTLIAALCCALTCTPSKAADQVPGRPQDRPIALVDATIHPVAGPVIAKGTLVFDAGRITYVGADPKLPAEATVISLDGKHVYPGLIDAYSDLGLTEISAVRATRDAAETGSINPNVKANVSVNPDSELIPVARANGVLCALTAPTGGLISGTSALMQLDGWTFEDMTLAAPVALHVNWPRMTLTADPAAAESRKRQIEQRDEALESLRHAFADARAYMTARQADPQGADLDARWEAMIPVLQGKTPVIVAADQIRQIQAAVAWAAREKVKLIIYGGYDAPQCAELLKQYDVPVIVAGVHRLPMRRFDPYDAPFTVPQRLHAAGVRFCISGDHRFRASMVRNLPYHAGAAAAYGLPPDEALKAITLYPAQILGVADHVGALAPGKDATLIVTTGDPLETPTHVTMAYIRGRAVDLSSRHTQLWEKYQEKYRRQHPAE